MIFEGSTRWLHKVLNVNEDFQVAMRSGKMHSECGDPGYEPAKTREKALRHLQRIVDAPSALKHVSGVDLVGLGTRLHGVRIKMIAPR